MTENNTDKFELIPLNDRIIVEVLPVEDETKGGVVIPDQVKQKPLKGIVKAVGPGRICDNCGKVTVMQVKVGDVVLYGKHVGSEIQHDGEVFFMLREGDCFAVLRDGKTMVQMGKPLGNK